MALHSAGPRACRLLRWAGALESSSLTASRGFSASASCAADAKDALAAGSGAPGADAWGEAAAAASDSQAAAAAGDGLAAVGEAASAAASSDVGSVLTMTMAAVDGLHAATGLPWWATIASVGLLVRTSMLPVSLQGMKASASLMPLLRQARDELVTSMWTPLPPLPLPPPPPTDGDARSAKKQRWQRAQQQAAAAAGAPLSNSQQQQQDQQQQQQQQQQVPAPSNTAILARFQELRRAAGAPHPIWVLASPLAQLPVFITAMATIRTMSRDSWPGFSDGGTAWFGDLTLPAMDLANWVAPMGTAGVVLPGIITISMLANIDAAFTVPAGSRQQASVMLYVMGGLRLFMEWMMVPLFAIAMQLPQGALCYWATSSCLGLAQNHALKLPAVRQAVGLPTAASQEQQQAQQAATGAAAVGLAAAPPTADAAAAAASALATGTAGPLPFGVDPELRQFLQTTSDQAALFDRAAALRAEGRAGATLAVLQRLLALYPGQPNALFALGQVHAALKDWQLSEQYYLQAAGDSQLDGQSRSRSWFGAGVAMHMQGEDETAIEAFQKAADLAQSDDLRVRAWVSQATLHRKLGQLEVSAKLLRKAARAEPKVEEAYLKPLLEEMAGGPAAGQQQQQQEEQEQEALAAGVGIEARVEAGPEVAAVRKRRGGK